MPPIGADNRTSNLLILLVPADDPLCHGRGREFESRRPRHFFSIIKLFWREVMVSDITTTREGSGLRPFIRTICARVFALILP
jgi:hypothetical protein